MAGMDKVSVPACFYKQSNDMKRVLIITYYWPPSGGGGVMRWLKMSKYLPEFGWQPVIYTPENPDPSVKDESLLKEIHPIAEIVKTPIWEPYDIYRKLTGKKKSDSFKAGYISEASRGSWKDKLSVFLRGNLLIPDPRVFWVNPSVRFLRDYLRKNPVDLMITTGPPHSMLLIGLKLKKYLDIPWLADFRDPWTEIDFYHRLKLTSWADRKHRTLEKKVLKSADIVTTVSPYLKNTTEKLAGRRVDVIYNGFDPEDFQFVKVEGDSLFTISHYGAFNRDRNPSALWRALQILKENSDDFARMLRIQLIGQTDESILREIRESGLEENLKLEGHLPPREGLQLLSGSQVLLLPLNDAPNVKGILPGKMYEYLALQRPILAIGPSDGDFAEILHSTHAGITCNFQDTTKMVDSLGKWYKSFLKGNLNIDSGGYDRFSRQNLARQIINLPFA
jgi:glycosyltransferase involved in cell wall biosynthesis